MTSQTPTETLFEVILDEIEQISHAVLGLRMDDYTARALLASAISKRLCDLVNLSAGRSPILYSICHRTPWQEGFGAHCPKCGEWAGWEPWEMLREYEEGRTP